MVSVKLFVQKNVQHQKFLNKTIGYPRNSGPLSIFKISPV